MPGDGGSCWWPLLSPQGRYVVVQLGVSALRSDTLNIGDHP